MRLPRIAVVGLIACFAVGCGGGSSEQPVASQTSEPATPSAQTPSTAPADPIGSVAYAFLEAVVAGDTPRATSLMTPEAIAQFAASEQGFASPELGAPSFSVQEVRKMDDKAAVQCLLNDGDGEAEMCCLMRLVGTQWRVSGVAYEVAADQPPVILNFEAPERKPAQQFVQQPGAELAPGAAPRTASEGNPAAIR